MNTVSTQISDRLYQAMGEVAKELKISNELLIREAISAYVDEMEEDIEDTNTALRVLSLNEPSYPLEEFFKRLREKDGLEER